MRNRIANIRRERGLSQAGLARALGVGRATVLRWENGTIQIPLETLEKIARFFHIPPSALIPALNDIPIGAEQPKKLTKTHKCHPTFLAPEQQEIEEPSHA